MSWKITNVSYMTEKGTTSNSILEDEKGNIVCSIVPEYNDYTKIIAHSPEMFNAINDFISQVKNGSLKPRTACKIFEKIISKIKD